MPEGGEKSPPEKQTKRKAPRLRHCGHRESRASLIASCFLVSEGVLRQDKMQIRPCFQVVAPSRGAGVHICNFQVPVSASRLPRASPAAAGRQRGAFRSAGARLAATRGSLLISMCLFVGGFSVCEQRTSYQCALAPAFRGECFLDAYSLARPKRTCAHNSQITCLQRSPA